MFKGKMGNQMFQYAACRIAAIKNSCNFYIYSHEEILHHYGFFKEGEYNGGDTIFINGQNVKIVEILAWSRRTKCVQLSCLLENGNFAIATSHDPTDGFHLSDFFDDLDMGILDSDSTELECFYEKEIPEWLKDEDGCMDLSKIPNFSRLDGFFQKTDYFKGYESLIKSWFKIDVTEKVSDFLKIYDPENYCYIHLRGGDYKEHGNWFLSRDYYENAIQIVKQKFPEMKFVIVTDDIEEAKKMFPLIDCISNDPKTDFSILMNSKYIIICNSTFSWWAAWLKEKALVIAPDNWLNYNSPEEGFFPKTMKTENFVYVKKLLNSPQAILDELVKKMEDISKTIEKFKVWIKENN